MFGEQVLQRHRRKAARTRDADAFIRDLTELDLGAPVVHEDHGVGRYPGMQTLTVGGITTEFITIEYAGGDKLYVPVSSLHLISRYSGAAPEQAPLHKLGSDQWLKAKRRAAESRKWPLPQAGSQMVSDNSASTGRSGLALTVWVMTGSSALLMSSCTRLSGV